MSERLGEKMAQIRRLALAAYGTADDATCFMLATAALLSEQQDGFHRAPPAKVPDLNLDAGAPIT